MSALPTDLIFADFDPKRHRQGAVFRTRRDFPQQAVKARRNEVERRFYSAVGERSSPQLVEKI